MSDKPKKLPPTTRPAVFHNLAWDRRVDVGAYRFFHILYDHLGQDEKIFPGHRGLLKNMGWNGESLKRWRENLAECGYLSFRQQKSGSKLYYTLLNGEGKPFPEKASGPCPTRSKSVTRKNQSRPQSDTANGSASHRHRKRNQGDTENGIAATPGTVSEVSNPNKGGSNNLPSQSGLLLDEPTAPPAFAGARREPGSPDQTQNLNLNQNQNAPAAFIKKGLDE